MAFIKLYRSRLQQNYTFLKKIFEEKGIEWGIVTKLLCGNKSYIQEIINLGIKEIHDSRVSNLEVVKKLNPEIRTIYIKPPPKRSIEGIVQYADVSLNTEFDTIKMLSDEALKQGKMHGVIIMIEMGDLREGIMGENLIAFYEKVFLLPAIKVVGIGANLNCINGIMPSKDKLIQLALYKQIIELKFNRKIPLVSGGTSVTIPLLLKQLMPEGINHFRVGETLYNGADLFDESVIEGMEPDVLELFAEIIEITEKPLVPYGPLGVNPQGEETEIDDSLFGKTAYRALLDIGALETSLNYLIPKDEKLVLEASSSDVIVVDLGDNEKGYKVGDLVLFRLKYMGALGLLNSNYVDKYIE